VNCGGLIVFGEKGYSNTQAETRAGGAPAGVSPSGVQVASVPRPGSFRNLWMKFAF
jgi:hypothetical protein